MKKVAMVVVGLSMAVLNAVAWALPSVQDVEAQVQQKHYAEAESMMKEVVAAKPESAKGHYIYAELLARNGHFAQAATETAKAKSLDPQIKFADADKFRAFEQLLQREQNPTPARTGGGGSLSNAGGNSVTAPALAPAPAPAAARSSGLPGWVWPVGLALVGWLLWRGFARSRGAGAVGASGGPGYGAPAAGYPAAPGTAPGMPYGQQPYAQPPGMQAAPGGGWMRTGAAVAGGVAAGMLADELLHRRDSSGSAVAGNDPLAGLQNPMFGPGTDSAANELENRDVDFGNGGDWDAGAGGSDIDTGSSGGSDDGWG